MSNSRKNTVDNYIGEKESTSAMGQSKKPARREAVPAPSEAAKKSEREQ